MSSSRDLSRQPGLTEYDQNLEQNVGASPLKRRLSGRRQSEGGEQRNEETSHTAAKTILDPTSFQLSSAGPSTDELSPRRRARRSMQPRKSILKPNIFAREDDTSDFTATRAEHTIAMGSLSRRVSFASKAYVRMFEKPTPKSPSAKRLSLPARQAAHSRRSSITNLASIAIAPRFVPEGEAEGEASMDMDDTASEQSDTSDEDGPVLGANPDGSRRYSGHGVQFTLGSSSAQAQVEPLEQASRSGDSDEEDDSGEMDMEVTQVVYGGIMDRRISMAASEVSEGDSLVSNGGEDQTVDFTIAVGGLMPHSPPVHAAANARASIGYAAPHSPSAGEGRFHPGQPAADELAMDETVAIGGIIGADDTMSTASSAGNETLANRERTMTFSFTPAPDAMELEEDGMEMTVAIGGVMERDMTQHTAIPASRQSMSNQSPFRAITRPASGTPSFARPTVSSATKVSSAPKPKRNIFGPSPSPTKAATPRKSGMETAGEVAKRLSFGSNASVSDSNKKRARSASIGDNAASSPSKRRAVEPMTDENVFTEQSVRIQVDMETRVRVGTPRKSMSAPSSSRLSVMPMKSPGKSPMLRRMLGQPPAIEDGEEMGEEQGRDLDDVEAEFEPPTIRLGSFLEMAGVQFIEALPGARRRSSVARGVLGRGQDGEREFALHDYTAAQVNNVFLNMYSWAANRMKTDISESAAQLAQTEADCSVHNPPVIKEYLSAGDDEKKIFEMTFKAFKINTQLKARERWYEWKMDLMARVKPDVGEILQGMQDDKQRLNDMESQTRVLLPELRARQAALQEELKWEREAVAELADCDQEELRELREAINEQGAQIKAFSSELSESTTQLEKLQANLADLHGRKNEAMGAITIAKGLCDQFTKGDVLRLQDEFKSLQSLHLWRPVLMSPMSFAMTYDSEFKLSMDCVNSQPDITSAKVERLPLCEGANVGRAVGGSWRGTGDSPTVGLFVLFEAAVAELIAAGAEKSVSTFIQHIGQLWSAVQRVRQELRLVHVQYPTTFTTSLSGPTTFHSTTSLMFPGTKSKVQLVSTFDAQALMRWPERVGDVDVLVKRVYGSADAAALTERARGTVKMAVSEGYLGYLLQACVDVSES